MTVFERIHTMSKAELQHLIYCIYMWGEINHMCGTSDREYFKRFLNYNANDIKRTLELDKLTLHTVKVIPCNGNEYYMDTKFYSMEDAQDYLVRFCHAVKAADDVYRGANAVYIIRPISQ